MKTMRVETEEDALLHCFDLWLWLACNPEKEKEKWPGWEECGGYLKEKQCLYCPCCEYVVGKYGPCWSGENCPIIWHEGGGGCVRKGSNFLIWSDSHIKSTRTKHALAIATKALEALERKGYI